MAHHSRGTHIRVLLPVLGHESLSIEELSHRSWDASAAGRSCSSISACRCPPDSTYDLRHLCHTFNRRAAPSAGGGFLICPSRAWSGMTQARTARALLPTRRFVLFGKTAVISFISRHHGALAVMICSTETCSCLALRSPFSFRTRRFGAAGPVTETEHHAHSRYFTLHRLAHGRR